MTVRSIDMQVALPRVADVAKNQHVQEMQPQLQQQQAAITFKEAKKVAQQRTQKTDKSEKQRIRREQEREKGSKQKQLNEVKNSCDTPVENNNDGNFSDPVRGHFVDIKT